MKVYVVKARYFGEEDDVFLFDNIEKAKAAVFEYFHRFEEDCIQEFKSIDDFENYLIEEELGYFSIYKEEVR